MKEKQDFTTHDSISVFALIGLVVAIVFYICLSNSREKKAELAREKASGYAGQILKYYNKNRGMGRTRYLASNEERVFEFKLEGRIGMDPWGRAFHYRIFPEIKGPTRVVVFSSGPDLSPELQNVELDAAGGDADLRVNDQGDDIVVQLRI